MSLSALGFIAIYAAGLWSAFFNFAPAAFLTYQFVYMANPAKRWWGATLPEVSWSLLTVVAIAAVTVVHHQSTSLNRLRDVAPMKWMIAILALNIALTPIAVSPVDHQRILIEFIKLVIIVAMAYKVLDSAKRIEISLWAYLIGAAYLGFVAHGRGRNSGGRLEGIGPVDSPDANGTATVLVPAIPILIALFCTGSLRVKVAVALLGVWIVNALVLLNSRGAFLGICVAAAMVMFALMFSKLQRAGQRASVILSIVLGLSGALYLADDAFWERMQTLESMEDDPENGAKRVSFWFKSFEIVSDYPLGAGAQGFHALSPFYLDDESLAGATSGRSVHSSWFQALVETGYLGLALLFGMCMSTNRVLKISLRTLVERREERTYWMVVAVRAGFIGYLCSITFMDRYRAEIFYWLVMYSACIYNVVCVRPMSESSGGGIPEPQEGKPIGHSL